MGSDLAELASMAGCPAAPVASEDVSGIWRQQTGLGLPSGYVELLERWGSGVFFGWIRVFSPAGRYHVVNLTDSTMANLLLVGADVAMWPDEGGMVVWGVTIDGDYLCFDQIGTDPEAWPVVIVDRYGDRVFEYQGSVLGFLVRLQTAARERTGGFGLGEIEEGDWDGMVPFESIDWEGP